MNFSIAERRRKVSALSSSTVSGPDQRAQVTQLTKYIFFPLFRLQKRISFVLVQSEVKTKTLVKQRVDEPNQDSDSKTSRTHDFDEPHWLTSYPIHGLGHRKRGMCFLRLSKEFRVRINLSYDANSL